MAAMGAMVRTEGHDTLVATSPGFIAVHLAATEGHDTLAAAVAGLNIARSWSGTTRWPP